MALVRGVICLSLSDWAPAVAPSFAPLCSPLPRPTAPHLSQMGGRMDGLRQEGGRDGKEGKDVEEKGRESIEEPTSRIMPHV